MNFFLILVAAMVASSSCFAASIRAKREYIGKSTDGSRTVHGRFTDGPWLVWDGLLTWFLRRIRIWRYRQFLSNREHWTWTSGYKRIEFRRNCPCPGLPTQSKFKTKIQSNWPMLGLNGRLWGSDVCFRPLWNGHRPCRLLSRSLADKKRIFFKIWFW